MVQVPYDYPNKARNPPERVRDDARTPRYSSKGLAPGLAAPVPAARPHNNQRQNRIHQNQRQRLRIATINVGTMTGRGHDLAKQLERRRVDICAVQETRWKGSAVFDKLGYGYEMLYHGTSSQRNGVGLIISKELRSTVFAVHRWTDRSMAVTLLIDKRRTTFVSAYAPQAGCDDQEKDAFWETLSDKLDNTPELGELFILGDFNAHVGRESNGYKCHGNHGYGDRNEEGERLLDFAEPRRLFIANTNFMKQESHLVTYASGGRKTQIDYIIVQMKNRRLVKNAKVFPDSCDAITTQHRLLVVDTLIPKAPKPIVDRTVAARVKWWRLQEKEQHVKFSLDLQLPPVADDIEQTWSELEKNVSVAAKKHLGTTKPGKDYIDKLTWLWTPAVQEAVDKKKTTYKLCKLSSHTPPLPYYENP